MDNVVTINNQKTNTLELDVSVQGLNTTDIRVWLCVAAEGMELCFECNREGHGEKWVVIVPPLPFITRTAYPCSVKIVADGYYFEPLNGTMNVIGSAEVYSSTPQNVELKPSDKTKTAEEEKVAEKVTVKALPPGRQPKQRSREKSIEQLAKELMEQKHGKAEGAADENNVIQIPVTKKAAAAQAKKLVEDEEKDKKAKLRSEEIDELIEKIRMNKAKMPILQPEPIVEKPVAIEEPIVEPVIEAPVDPIVEEPVAIEEPIVEEVIVEEIIEEIIEEPVVEVKDEVVEDVVVEDVVEKAEETIVETDVVEEKVKEVKKDEVVKDIIKTTKPKKTRKKRKVQEKLEIPKKEIAGFKPPVEPKAKPNEGAVREVIEELSKRAKQFTKKKAVVPEIPKRDIADFKLKPRKIEAIVPQSRNDAIKAILEDLGLKMDKSGDIPPKFIVRSNATRSEDGYDIEAITEELKEKSGIDDDVEKKLASLKEVAETPRDTEIMAILEEIGIKPKGAPAAPRVSFIKKETHQK